MKNILKLITIAFLLLFSVSITSADFKQDINKLEALNKTLNLKQDKLSSLQLLTTKEQNILDNDNFIFMGKSDDPKVQEILDKKNNLEKEVEIKIKEIQKQIDINNGKIEKLEIKIWAKLDYKGKLKYIKGKNGNFECGTINENWEKYDFYKAYNKNISMLLIYENYLKAKNEGSLSIYDYLKTEENSYMWNNKYYSICGLNIMLNESENNINDLRENYKNNKKDYSSNDYSTKWGDRPEDFYKDTKFNGKNYNGALKKHKDGERITVKGQLFQGNWGDFVTATEKGPLLIYGNDEYGISNITSGRGVEGGSRTANIGTFYKKGELRELMNKNISFNEIGDNGISVYLSQKIVDGNPNQNYLGQMDYWELELSGVIRDIKIDNNIEFCDSYVDMYNENIDISCYVLIRKLKYKFLKGEIDIEQFKKEVISLLDNVFTKHIKQDTKIFIVDKIKKGENYSNLIDISDYKDSYQLSKSYKNKLNILLEKKLFPLEKKKKGTLFNISKKIDKIISEKKLKKGTKTYEILKYIQNKIYYGNKEKNELLKTTLETFKFNHYTLDPFIQGLLEGKINQ